MWWELCDEALLVNFLLCRGLFLWGLASPISVSKFCYKGGLVAEKLLRGKIEDRKILANLVKQDSCWGLAKAANIKGAVATASDMKVRRILTNLILQNSCIWTCTTAITDHCWHLEFSCIPVFLFVFFCFRAKRNNSQSFVFLSHYVTVSFLAVLSLSQD